MTAAIGQKIIRNQIKEIHDRNLSSDSSRKEYGPHIFARVNYAYQVFREGSTDPRFLRVWGHRRESESSDLYHCIHSYASFRTNFADRMCITVHIKTGRSIPLFRRVRSRYFCRVKRPFRKRQNSVGSSC